VYSDWPANKVDNKRRLPISLWKGMPLTQIFPNLNTHMRLYSLAVLC